MEKFPERWGRAGGTLTLKRESFHKKEEVVAAESEQKTSYIYNFNGYEKIQLLKITWLPILSSFSLLQVKVRKASTVEQGERHIRLISHSYQFNKYLSPPTLCVRCDVRCWGRKNEADVFLL